MSNIIEFRPKNARTSNIIECINTTAGIRFSKDAESKKIGIIDISTHKLKVLIDEALDLFIDDPPDSEYQCGYLSALISVYCDMLDRPSNDQRIVIAHKMIKDFYLKKE